MNTKTIKFKITTFAISAVHLMLIGVISLSPFAILANTDNGFSVSTYPASSVSKRGATFNGHVSGTGGSNSVWFRYGTNYSNLKFTTQKIGVANNRSFYIFVSGLEENKTYYYQSIATSEEGIAYGNTLNFTTNITGIFSPSESYNNTSRNVSIPTTNNTNEGVNPIVITRSPKEITQTSTIIEGLALPGGNVATTGWFEWGTTASLAKQTAHGNIANSGSRSIVFSGEILGLFPNTTYYYRAVINNKNGTSYGNTLNLRTKQTPVLKQTASVLTVNTKPISKKTVEEKPTIEPVSEKSKFFPNTLVGWSILLALFLMIIALINNIYNVYQTRKKELEDNE